jgi:hypothetical protein
MGIPTHFPRLDFMSSQGTSAILQFLHGFSSITLHRTRRELHALHAFFARDRGRPPAVVSVELVVMLSNLMVQAYRRCALDTIQALLTVYQSRAEALKHGDECCTVAEVFTELLT